MITWLFEDIPHQKGKAREAIDQIDRFNAGIVAF